MDKIVIEEGSEAFEYLQAAFAGTKAYKISLDARRDGVAIKVNEYAWTHTMETTPRPSWVKSLDGRV